MPKMFLNCTDAELALLEAQAKMHGITSVHTYVRQVLFPGNAAHYETETRTPLLGLAEETVRRIGERRDSPFILKDLYSPEEWANYDAGEKRATGKYIYAHRDELGLVDAGKNTSNQQVYELRED